VAILAKRLGQKAGLKGAASGQGLHKNLKILKRGGRPPLIVMEEKKSK
jgi:hypothetical protein